MENTNYKDEIRIKYVDLFIKELDNEIISRQIERSIFNYVINLFTTLIVNYSRGIKSSILFNNFILKLYSL